MIFNLYLNSFCYCNHYKKWNHALNCNVHMAFSDLFFLLINIVKASLVSIDPELDIISLA